MHVGAVRGRLAFLFLFPYAVGMTNDKQNDTAGPAVSTINLDEHMSTVLVNGERVMSVTLVADGSGQPFLALAVGPEPTASFVSPSLLLHSVEAVDALIDKLRFHRAQLADVVDVTRGGDIVEAFAGTSFGRFWGEQIDADREGRAA